MHLMKRTSSARGSGGEWIQLATSSQISRRQLLASHMGWAEMCGRTADMVTFAQLIIKESADTGVELDPEERQLVSFAFKHAVSELRTAWRKLAPVEVELAGQLVVGERRGELRSLWYDQMRAEIQLQMVDLCNDLEGYIENLLMPVTGSVQGKVFFRKMVADYCRYLCEMQEGEARKDTAERALRNYRLAITLAEASLDPTDHVRLGVVLNFSVFYWEIMHFRDRARNLAQTAVDDAMAVHSRMQEGPDYHNSVLILELINDNLKLWCEEEGDEVGTKMAVPLAVKRT